MTVTWSQPHSTPPEKMLVRQPGGFFVATMRTPTAPPTAEKIVVQHSC
jgi:hypothetical protein